MDLEEKELPGVVYRVVEQMAVDELIGSEDKPTVMRALLLKHRHVHESDSRFRFNMRRNTSSYSSLQVIFFFTFLILNMNCLCCCTNYCILLSSLSVNYVCKTVWQ